MNRQSISQTLESLPALSLHGWGVDSHSFASNEDALASFEQGRQMLLESEVLSGICQLLTGVRHSARIEVRAHSYSLKGLFDCALGVYCSEGEVILAVVHLGYRWERVGASARFAMSMDDLELIRKRLPPSRPYDWW